MLIWTAVSDNGDGSCSPLYFKTKADRDKWCDENPEDDRSEGGSVLDTEDIDYVDPDEGDF